MTTAPGLKFGQHYFDTSEPPKTHFERCRVFRVGQIESDGYQERYFLTNAWKQKWTEWREIT